MTIDTFLGILGAITGVLGLITGYVFYKLGTKSKEPCISIRSINLIRDYVATFDNVDILYNGKQVKSLTVTTIMFWNNGRETIDKQDISKAEPLKIKGVNDVRILDVKIISVNNNASLFDCPLIDNDAHIYFDYLDKKQGAVIQVVHTGVKDSDVDIVGKIKGVDRIKYKKYNEQQRHFLPLLARFVNARTERRITAILFFILGLLLVSFVIYTFYQATNVLIQNNWKSPTRPSTNEEWFFTFLIIIAIILSGPLFIWSSISVWRNQAPQGLDAFEE